MAKKKEFDRTEWLNEVLKGEDVSKEEREALDKVLGREKVSSNLAASVMRLSDYSSKQDELRQAKEEFEGERKKAKQEHSERLQKLAEWEGTAKQTLAEEQKAKAELEKQLQLANRKYQKAVRAAGLDDDDLDDEDLPAAPKVNGLSREEIDKYWAEREKALRADIKKEFEEGASDLVKMIGPYPVKLMALAREHEKLFDEQLDIDALYKKHLETERPMDELWARDYKVSERRAEIEEEALNQKIQAARDEERKAVMEEMARPQMVEPESFGSPAMKQFAAKPGESKDNGLTAIDRAVLAHREHKHAPPTSPHFKGNQQGTA